MKKTLAILAATALVFCISCKKDNGSDKKDKGKEETPEYVAPITIDGDFSDWAKLDASKVASAKSEEGASHEALKLVKVYADAYYVYIYFEWDKELIEFNSDEFVPFHIYLNGDGDITTGGFADQFTDACTELLFEGFLTDGEKIISYEPSAFKWAGEVNGSGWEWEDIDSASGLCSGAGVVGKYELSITRELYPLGKLADNFSIGFDIQQAWDSAGILPNSVEGTAETLQVVTDK